MDSNIVTSLELQREQYPCTVYQFCVLPPQPPPGRRGPKYITISEYIDSNLTGRGHGSMLVFHKDDRISHKQLGLGTIIEADDRYTVISFDTGGVRKFVTRLVQLDVSDVPAPPPAPPMRKRRVRSTEPPIAVTVRHDA